jgi:Reverse transcriptase (RNA-dependent DNA polymerase)
MTVEELTPYLKEHWPAIRARLLDGTYRPLPVRRVEIPKPGGGKRALGIPSLPRRRPGVLDRFVEQAVLQVLQGRMGRDVQHEQLRVSAGPLGASGGGAGASADCGGPALGGGHRPPPSRGQALEKLFGRVNHDLLMGLVATRVGDQRILRLIRGLLSAGVLADGLAGPTAEGTPQGGPLSPLLSNLMLDVRDKELERRGHRFVGGACPRAAHSADPWADGGNIYVQSRRAGERVMAGVERFLTRHLKLTVNRAKSAVARPAARKFLGFSCTGEAEPRRRIAAGARPVREPGAGPDPAHSRGEPGVRYRPAVGLSDGLARRFRVLSNARAPAQSARMGQTATALPCRGAMAHRQATLHRAAPPRDRPLARRHHHGGGAPARPLEAQSARPSTPLCQTPSSPPAVFPPWLQSPHDAATEPPCTDPYARWCGRGGAAKLPPIPIVFVSTPQGVDGRDKPGQGDLELYRAR